MIVGDKYVQYVLFIKSSIKSIYWVGGSFAGVTYNIGICHNILDGGHKASHLRLS